MFTEDSQFVYYGFLNTNAYRGPEIGLLEADGLPSLDEDHYFIVSLRQLDRVAKLFDEL